MNWQIIGIIIALIVFVISFWSMKHRKKDIKKQLGSASPIGRKLIVFATPNRVERILLSLFFFFFFISDLAQNKFIDLGIDYSVIVFWHMKALALDVWVIFLILFHVVLMSLFLMSLQSKATNKIYDIIVGVVAFFGVAILLAGVVVQIYNPEGLMRFLFVDWKPIDFYHLGVYLEMFAGFYWAFTK